MIEIWKDVPNYENYYQASSLGKIYSKYKNRIVNGSIDREGYRDFCLRKNGEAWRQRVSRIVYRTFKEPNLLSTDLVHHGDHNKNNDCITNLFKTNRSEHKKQHHPEIGAKTRFNKMYNLPEDEIRNLRKSRLTYVEISKKYNCSEITIRRIFKPKKP